MKQRGAEALFRYREHWEELTFKLDQIRKQNSAAIGRSTLKALVRTESTGTFLSRLGSLLSLSDESRSRLAEEHRTLHQLRDAAIEQVSVGSVTWLSAQREEVSKFEALKEDVKSLLKDGDSRYFRAAWALYPTLYRKQIDRFIAGAWTLAYGKSHERYRCAYRIRSLLRTSNLSCDESFSRDIADRLLGLVKWLFLDDNTGVWKLGAECLGLLALGEDNDAFAYLNDAITRSKGSTEGQAKLRLERHGFAALGWAALHNPGFVREKVDSLLPRADESKKTFNRPRRNAGVGEDPFIVRRIVRIFDSRNVCDAASGGA